MCIQGRLRIRRAARAGSGGGAESAVWAGASSPQRPVIASTSAILLSAQNKGVLRHCVRRARPGQVAGIARARADHAQTCAVRFVCAKDPRRGLRPVDQPEDRRPPLLDLRRTRRALGHVPDVPDVATRRCRGSTGGVGGTGGCVESPSFPLVSSWVMVAVSTFPPVAPARLNQGKRLPRGDSAVAAMPTTVKPRLDCGGGKRDRLSSTPALTLRRSSGFVAGQGCCRIAAVVVDGHDIWSVVFIRSIPVAACWRTVVCPRGTSLPCARRIHPAITCTVVTSSARKAITAWS
jgi:hypothetical protein